VLFPPVCVVAVRWCICESRCNPEAAVSSPQRPPLVNTRRALFLWKYLYNRPAPARTDAGITTIVPPSDLPSCPSKDAVLSGVTAEMLRLLFPAAVEEITKRAAEQREAALLSGRATASDIAAGLALGRAVAAAVIARAGADGMRNAIGTPAQWSALADSAVARGEIPWVSQESPVRPPMLPNFGQVRTWILTADQMNMEAPPPPPSTSSAQFREELDEVRRTVNGLTRRQLAIALKWNDGAGTYTPPGHWNDIAAENIRDACMSEVRTARVFALLNSAMHDAAVGCWGVTFRHFNPRPSQLDPSIKTVIGLPNFPAFPSGHSTFSAAAAGVLSYLFRRAVRILWPWPMRPGSRACTAASTTGATSIRGQAHGQRIGALVVQYAQNDGAH